MLKMVGQICQLAVHYIHVHVHAEEVKYKEPNYKPQVRLQRGRPMTFIPPTSIYTTQRELGVYLESWIEISFNFLFV